MKKIWSVSLFYFGAFVACFILAFTTGCASGGFKLTREYARWVNSQNIILRIVLYIFTSVVFAVTLLIDFVIFNTIDFWEGKISAGSYEFEKDGRTYQVQHEVNPDSQLKRSTIEIRDEGAALVQKVVLRETPSGEIELFVDGKLRTRVRGISEIPIATVYDVEGNFVSENLILSAPVIAGR